MDPLGVKALADFDDPLSTAPTKPRVEVSETRGYATTLDRKVEERSFLECRQQILSEFKSDELLRIGNKLLEEATDNKTDASRARDMLEKVERSNEKRKEKRRDRLYAADGLSQQDLIDQLDKVVKDMETAWEEDRKVDTLKAVIESVRYIEAAAQPTLYPYVATLVHKFLDSFGNLVFTRVMRRVVNPNLKSGQAPPTRLPAEIPDDVPGAAAEMARNWLYKIGCIRELIPRTYIEAALIRLNFFFRPSRATVLRNCARLMRQCRCIGDPLVATYARLYITHVVATAADSSITSAVATIGWEDWLATMAQWRGVAGATNVDASEAATTDGPSASDVPYRTAEIVKETVGESAYAQCMMPAVGYMVKSFGRSSAAPSFEKMLSIWERDVKVRAALRALVCGYLPGAVGPHIGRVLALARSVEGKTAANEAEAEGGEGEAVAEGADAEGASVPLWRMYEALGAAAAAHPPADKRARLALLNEAWTTMSKGTANSLCDFIRCCSAWLPYVSHHLSLKQVSLLLRELKERIDEEAKGEVGGVAGEALARLLRSFAGQTEGSSPFDMSSGGGVDAQGPDGPATAAAASAAGGGASAGRVDVITVLSTDDFVPLMDFCPVSQRVSIALSLLKQLISTAASSADRPLSSFPSLALSAAGDAAAARLPTPSAAKTAGLGTLSDSVVVASGLELCREVHDAFASLRSDDERREAEDVIIRYVDMVWYGDSLQNLDRMYTFIAELPHAFPRLDRINEAMTLKCMRVCAVVMRTCDLRQKTRKPAMFAQNCLAFCHMSIPSIPDPFVQARLFAQTATLSLCGNYLPQCHLLFRSALSVLATIPPSEQLPNRTVVSNDAAVLELLSSLCSAVVLAPGHPEHGPLYLVEALLTFVEDRKWDDRAGAADAATSRASAYSQVLNTCCTLRREELPYHSSPADVRHNDTLFAFNAKYQALCDETAATALEGFLESVAEATAAGEGGGALPPAIARRLQGVVCESVCSFVHFVDFDVHTKLRKVR